MIAVALEQRARLEDKLRRGLGDAILSHLKDPTTEDVFRNPDGRVWCKGRGRPCVPIGEMSEAQALDLAGTVAACYETVINYERPIFEGDLPLEGSRFEAIVRPVSRATVLAIRRLPEQSPTLDDYASSGSLTYKDDPLNRRGGRESFLEEVQGLSHAEILRRAVTRRKNVLVVGATGVGKTTLLMALLKEIAALTPHDRLITVEDTPEIRCGAQNYVGLFSVKSIGVEMVHCVRAVMRLRPTRIVVGEVRGPEALELLKCWQTGHPGGVATVHATSAMEGLDRLENLVAEATPAAKQRLIATTIDLVVFIDEETTLPAGRKVREVAVVAGYEQGRYSLEYV